MSKFNRDDILKALEHCKSPKLTKCNGCPREQEDGHCMYRLNEDALALIKELTTKTEAQDIVISELRHRVEKAEHDAERYSKKIKELTEENKAWQKQLITTEEKADKAYYDLACEVENLRAENANLHASCTELTRKCASLTDECVNYKSIAEYQQKCNMDRGFEIKRLTEENERLKSVEFTCGFVKPHKVLECPIFDEIAKAKSDTVRKMQERLKMEIDRFGKKGGFVSKEVVAWFIDQITKEMLGDDNSSSREEIADIMHDGEYDVKDNR